MAIKSKLSYAIKMLIIEYLKTDNDELRKQLREKNMPVDKDKLVRMMSTMDLRLSYKNTKKDIFEQELMRRNLGNYISEVNNPSHYGKVEDEECNVDNEIPGYSEARPKAQNKKIDSGTSQKRESPRTGSGKKEKYTMPCKQCGKLVETEKMKGLVGVWCEECSKNPAPNQDDDSESSGCLSTAAIILIVVGILLSLTGVGTIGGIPLAGAGGIAYMLARSGLLIKSGHSGLGCLAAIIVIIFISFIVIASLPSIFR